MLSLPEAVRRMTSLSARTFGMVDRGVVKEGSFADLCLFDPEVVIDKATYDEPKLEAAGINMVVVNGQVAFDHGQHTGAGTGKMLRYQRAAFAED